MAINEPDTAMVTETLQKVAKGAGIVFVGSIFGVIIAFVTRILIARHFTQTEYGIFSLGFTILSIFVMIGTLGLQDGIARQIAFYHGKGKGDKVISIVSYSILFAIFVGIILFLIAFFLSDILSINFFNLPALSHPLKIFSTAIPFFILIYIITAIFRGFGSAKERAIFQDVLRNLLFLFLLFFIIWVGYPFDWVIVAYSVSIISTSIFFIVYFLIKSPLFSIRIHSLDLSIGKELIFFSFPLFLITILYYIMGWTDTIMLGYFKSAEAVGLYNAASPLGRFISMALASTVFIYMPISSELFVKNKISDMKRSYNILTKWVCIGTLPLVVIFVFFPYLVMTFLFGFKYALAGTALQILAIGFFVNNLMGPNGAVLTAMGKTRFLMYTSLVAACINIILNSLLIPRYGINGAAIATVTSLILINVIKSIKLYSISKIHSLEKNVLKPIILFIIIAYIIYFISTRIFAVTFWMLPLLFIFFVVIYVLSLFFTKSFDKEDIEILTIICKKIKIGSKSNLKKFLKRFI